MFKYNFFSKLTSIFYLCTGIITIFSANTAIANSISGKPVMPLHHTAKNWFVYELSAGESYTDSLEVFNNSDHTALIHLIAIDGLSHDSSEEFLLKNKDEKMTEIGSWIDFEEDYVIVPAHSSSITHFTITIPRNYKNNKRRNTGGILFEDVSFSMTNEFKKQTSSAIELSTQAGVRIYNTLPS